jgi:predicted O-methyltransferase YrrM
MGQVIEYYGTTALATPLEAGKYPKGILLDVGCQDRKQANFVGIDWKQRPGVDIVHDLESFPYPIESESCHTIKCVHVVEHILPRKVFDFMNELWRMLMPNGQLMISTPYANSPGFFTDPTHVSHFTEVSWQLFDPQFPLYTRHEPKPWKIEHSSWKPDGNIEAILRKLPEIGDKDAYHIMVLTNRAMTIGAMQKPVEIMAFLQQIKDRPLSTVVEIGTAMGGIFYVLCQMATKSAMLVSLDLPGADFSDGKFAEVEKIRDFGKPDQTVQLIRDDSHLESTKEKLVQILDGRKIDLLFIDGDHRYDGVKKDWKMYSPLVAKGGLVVFHDIVPHPIIPSCQVDKLWNELKPKHKTLDIVDPSQTTWGGIGIIEMGAKI